MSQRELLMTFVEERRGQSEVRREDGILSSALTPCGTQRVVSVGPHSLKLPAPVTVELGPAYTVPKRALDVVASGTLLILLFPVFLLVAVLIYLEDRGPIFFYQTRV